MSSDDDFEIVADVSAPDTNQPQPTPTEFAGGGGFIVDDNQAMSGGGGFIPDDDHQMEIQLEPPHGGGFVLDDDPARGSYAGGGGFIVDDGEGEGGGFLPETGAVGGGGFLPEDSPSNDSHTVAGGGFLPEDEDPNLTTAPTRTTNQPLFRSSSHPSPAPQPSFSRIGLSAIPAALDALHWNLPFPSDSPDVLALFEEIASDDGVLPEPSVRRDRFEAACRELRESDEEGGDGGGEGEEEEEEGRARPGRRAKAAALDAVESGLAGESSEGESEDGEEYVPEGKARPRGVPKRATRAHPKADPHPAPLASQSSDALSSLSSDSDAAPTPKRKPTKAGGSTAAAGAGKKGAQGRSGKRGEPSERQVAAARDTFDLFFERSTQIGQDGRTIGVDELRQVVGMLNEELSEMEMKEMLEYALSGAGTGGEGVDLPAFAKILADID